MANVFEKVSMLGAEALMHLEDALVISSLAAKDVTSDFTTRPNGYAVGDTINFKTRPTYEAKEFASTIERQDVRESKRPMIIEKHFDISVELTAKELALEFESFVEQVIQPAAYTLAEKVDVYVGTKILQGAGLYAGGGASVLSTAADMALARKAAQYQQLNAMGRFGIIDDTLEARLLGADYFNTYNVRGSDNTLAMREGILGRAFGFDWAASLNFPNATTHVSSSGTTATDNGAGANNLVGVSTLTVDAITGGFTAGDRIQVAGVRRPLIVKTTVSAAATAIELVDPITEIIPDGAAVTVIGAGETQTYRGALFDNRSLAVAFPILDQPEDKVATVVGNNGVSIRLVKGYDMDTKKTTLSMDLLVGAFALDPRRITLLADSE